MESTLTKTQFLEHLQTGHAQLQATLAALSHEQMLEPNVVGEWSVKDVLAHLVLHEQLALQELISAQKGETLYIEPNSTDRANAIAVAEGRDVSVSEAIANWEHSYQEVLGTLQALPEADYTAASPLFDYLGDTIQGTFANNTYEHYEEHGDMIRAHFYIH